MYSFDSGFVFSQCEISGLSIFDLVLQSEMTRAVHTSLV
jgi:hypothetical protein